LEKRKQIIQYSKVITVYSIVTNIKDTIWDYRKVSASSLLIYFFRGLKIFFFINGHLKLNKVLKPLHTGGLLTPKIGHIYLFKYLSGALNTTAKLSILTNHYNYFQNKFPKHIAMQIFKEGLVCWKEVKDAATFEIRLISNTPFENEGSLSMIFTMNDVTLYKAAFTFSPGNKFGLVDDQIIYVTRLQGAKSSLDIISKASKFFNDNTPPTLLVSTMEGLALSLGIKTILGINSQNQISFINNKNNHTQFYRCYDEFWETFDSVKIHTGDYLLSLPLNHKTISLIKSKHRNRTINKRKVRQELSRKTYIYFNEKLSGVRKINTSYLTVVKEVSKAEAC
jgi:uncharacterized protein VirK/YbjX